MKDTVTLTKNEFLCMCRLCCDDAMSNGEDVIGMLMKNGAFRFLNDEDDGGLVRLSQKIEEGDKEFQSVMKAKLLVEKEENRKRWITEEAIQTIDKISKEVTKMQKEGFKLPELKDLGEGHYSIE